MGNTALLGWNSSRVISCFLTCGLQKTEGIVLFDVLNRHLFSKGLFFLCWYIFLKYLVSFYIVYFLFVPQIYSLPYFTTPRSWPHWTVWSCFLACWTVPGLVHGSRARRWEGQPEERGWGSVYPEPPHPEFCHRTGEVLLCPPSSCLAPDPLNALPSKAIPLSFWPGWESSPVVDHS